MALPRYFMRQLSTRWFNRYLIICGLLFNLFALFSIYRAIFTPIDRSQWQARKVRMELEDAQLCSKHLNNQTLERGPNQKFTLTGKDGATVEVPYRSLSTFGYSKDGEKIEAVDAQFGTAATAQASSILFLITTDDRKIARCLPSYSAYRSQQLECVAASGEFQSNGDCLLDVHQPSDCELMKGSLTGMSCRVPSNGRILRASNAPLKGGTCVAQNCAPKNKSKVSKGN